MMKYALHQAWTFLYLQQLRYPSYQLSLSKGNRSTRRTIHAFRHSVDWRPVSTQENKHRIGLDFFPSCIIHTAHQKSWKYFNSLSIGLQIIGSNWNRKLVAKANARVQFCSVSVRSDAYFPEWKSALTLHMSAMATKESQPHISYRWTAPTKTTAPWQCFLFPTFWYTFISDFWCREPFERVCNAPETK